MVEEQKNKFQQPGRVKLIKGSILQPHDAGLRMILNLANMAGKVDGAIYKIFDKKWPKIKQEVRGAYVTKTGAYKLGIIANNLAAQSDVWAISILCQDEEQKTNIEALEKCLGEVRKLAIYEHGSVHVSSILTDEIPELQDLITKQLVEHGVAVCYYEEEEVAS
jgi:hypothetical protein